MINSKKYEQSDFVKIELILNSKVKTISVNDVMSVKKNNELKLIFVTAIHGVTQCDHGTCVKLEGEYLKEKGHLKRIK